MHTPSRQTPSGYTTKVAPPDSAASMSWVLQRAAQSQGLCGAGGNIQAAGHNGTTAAFCRRHVVRNLACPKYVKYMCVEFATVTIVSFSN